MDTPAANTAAATAGPDDLADNIRRQINRAELRRQTLHNEIDNPPEKVSVYYFTDRLDELRGLTLMIVAVRDVLNG